MLDLWFSYNIEDKNRNENRRTLFDFVLFIKKYDFGYQGNQGRIVVDRGIGNDAGIFR